MPEAYFLNQASTFGLQELPIEIRLSSASTPCSGYSNMMWAEYNEAEKVQPGSPTAAGLTGSPSASSTRPSSPAVWSATPRVSGVSDTQQNSSDVFANGIDSTNLDKAQSRFVKRNISYRLGNKNGKASQRYGTAIESGKGCMDN